MTAPAPRPTAAVAPPDGLTGLGMAASAAGLLGILAAAAGGMGLVICTGVLTLAGLAGAVRHRQAFVRPLGSVAGLGLLIPALAFTVWFVATASWSPARQGDALAYVSWQLLASVLAVFALRGITQRDAGVSVRALMAMVAGAGFILALEAVSGYGILRLANPAQDVLELERTLGRGAVAVVVLGWLAVLAGARLALGSGVLVGLALLAGFVGTRFGMDMNVVLYGAAGMAAVLAYALPRLTLGLLFGGMAGLVLAAPWVYPFLGSLIFRIWPDQTGPLSYERRAQMWEYAAARIAEKPVLGWGLDASRIFDGRLTYRGFEWANIQLHPHASPLQVWLELGVVGAALMALLLAGAGFCAVRTLGRDRLAAAGLASAMAALFIAFSFSFGAWQPWLWALVTLAVGWALALHRLQPVPETDSGADRDPDLKEYGADGAARP
jgi:O-antigen ligase